MPSLNLRAALKRNPNRLTLKQRAAALKATAGRVMRRRVVEAAPVVAGADPRLAAMVAELLEARRKLNDPLVPDGPETATLTGLLVRVRILNWRMTRASARLSDREDAADSAILLAGAREWVRLHIRLAKLFDMPVPENVAELRDLFGEPGGPAPAEPPSVAHPDRATAVLPK